MAATELLFKALADTTRQRILRALSVEELSVTELVEVLGQPQSTVSRHLKVLRDAGLLLDRRSGATVLYSACPPVLPPAEKESRPVASTGESANGSTGEVGTAYLRDRLLAWMGQQPVDAELRERLERVVRSRGAGQADFFDTVGARWDQLRIDAFGDSFHLEALTWLLPSHWTVADVGTGTGYLLPLLSTRFREVIAVDPSEAMLQVARNRPELRGATNVAFRVGSLARLPIDDGALDLAIASLVLHHVAEPAAALTELRRCLRSGAKLLVVEQEAHQFAEFHERMGDPSWGFEPEVLAEVMQKAGFEVARMQWLTAPRNGNRRGMEAPRLFVMIAG